MKEQFLRHVGKSGLFTKEDKILLAVSGGLDSMVMFDLFLNCGFTIGVAHVNFQLRGNESDADTKLVEDICKQKNIPCYTARVDTKSYAAENNLSTQVAARELRYSWFQEVMGKNGYTRLATAHHRNDNLETILLNITRGTELKTIPQKNDYIVRPLLPFPRQALESYANEKALTWRDDSSNATDLYPRNFIRHHVVPRLKELNSSFEESAGRTIDHLALLRELFDDSIERIKTKVIRMDGDRVVITKQFERESSQPGLLLFELIKVYDFNVSQCYDVVSALHGEPGKIFLSPGYKLVIDRNDLIIDRHEKFWEATTITQHQTEAGLGSWTLSFEQTSNLKIEKDNFVALFDKDLVKFPLTWRVWQAGDFFYPLGMEHKKKLSDFLIDLKLSRADKDYVTVLESAGEIVWVVGYRIDNRFKITSKTNAALRVTLDQYFI
jgi:tRNA(Ile)-lysidine synthase